MGIIILYLLHRTPDDHRLTSAKKGRSRTELLAALGARRLIDVYMALLAEELLEPVHNNLRSGSLDEKGLLLLSSLKHNQKHSLRFITFEARVISRKSINLATHLRHSNVLLALVRTLSGSLLRALSLAFAGVPPPCIIASRFAEYQ